MKAWLVALAVPALVQAQPAGARILVGAGLAVPVATSGSPSFTLAIATQRQRFAGMRTGGELGYMSLGSRTRELTYTNQTTATERLKVHRGLWYAGWLAHAGNGDSRRPHWLALTGVAHIRRAEHVSVQEAGAIARASFGAHATGPMVAVGVSRRTRRAAVEARATSALFMDEGLVTLLTVRAWFARGRTSRGGQPGDR